MRVKDIKKSNENVSFAYRLRIFYISAPAYELTDKLNRELFYYGETNNARLQAFYRLSL